MSELLTDDPHPLAVISELTEVDRTVEITCLYRNLHQAFAYMVKHRPPWACKNREAVQTHEEYLEEVYSPEHPEEVKDYPPEQVGWLDLDSLARRDMDDMLTKWEEMRWAALAELERGYTGSAPVCPPSRTTPWGLAEYLAQRERLLQDLNPQTGIERTLIDMLAQAYCAYTRWLAILTHRTSWHARELSADEIKWELPRQDEAQAIEQARAMADSFHRMFMRTLRQLRDWRRVSPPVVVQNAGQVNVGSQQVNLAEVNTPSTAEGSRRQ